MHWVNFIIAITSLPPSLPPSHQSLPPINNRTTIYRFSRQFMKFPVLLKFCPPPPNSPGNPPPRSGVDQQFFLLVSGQFMTFPGLFFFFIPLKPPMQWDPPPPEGTLIFLGSLCQCLSDETLKAVGPFYLVSMPGEVKDSTSPHWNV